MMEPMPASGTTQALAWIARPGLLEQELARAPLLPVVAMALGMQHMESADWDRAVARHDALPLADALNCRVAMVERDGELLAVMGALLDRRARLWLQARFEGRPVLFALACRARSMPGSSRPRPASACSTGRRGRGRGHAGQGGGVDFIASLAKRRKPGDPAGEHDAL